MLSLKLTALPFMTTIGTRSQATHCVMFKASYLGLRHCKQSCSFWLRYQPNHSFGGWGIVPDPTGGAYNAPPDSLAVFRGHTSEGKKGRGGRKGGPKPKS